MASLRAKLLFSLFSLSLLSICASTDTISSNFSLSGTQQKLISSQGKFALGFFQPGNSSYWYIGIWYNTLSIQTAVFVANRNIPISNPSSSNLTISNSGNLVLLNESKAEVWSTNITDINSNKTEAVLFDTGNLVLRYVDNTSNILWQSLDHPTDTWLPGGKLGLNKVTGVSQRLYSWKSSADPSEGISSIELDPNGTSQYFIQWNKSNTYWTSGEWSPTEKIFVDVPEMTENFIYNFTFVNNDKESYFVYSVKPTSTLISRFVMDYTGQIKQYTWLETTQNWNLFWSQPRQQCDVYALCGPYGSCNGDQLPYCNCIKGFSPKSKKNFDLGDYSDGCVRNTLLQCETKDQTKVKQDKFYTMDDSYNPDNAQSVQVGSAEECESNCLKNCSCTAYSYQNGCNLWFGDLINNPDDSGNSVGTVYLRLAASEIPDSKKHKGLVIGVVIGCIALVVLCTIICFIIYRRKRERPIRLLKDAGGSLIAFRYSDLQYLTKKFSDKLGGGAFGSVFKGNLPDSTVIAVKRLDGFNQGEKQFRAEVSTIGTIQHVNLVRLIGFCSEGNNRLLVYEYMPKSSLDVQLFNSRDVLLSWSTRYQIALGTARGLQYLHEKCRDCIIHCDIKPENILLDDNLVPKVADFGLAKLVGRDFSRVLTTMRGTRGYLAPEWITGVPITPKADVYSYGMMLFELISGRRNNSDQGDKISGFFPTYAVEKLTEGDIQTLLDSKLNGEDASIEEIERACKVACWCIQDDESARPTMGQVVQILEGFLEVNMPPIPLSLRVLGESPDYINFFSDISSATSSKTRSSKASNSGSSSLSKNSG